MSTGIELAELPTASAPDTPISSKATSRAGSPTRSRSFILPEYSPSLPGSVVQVAPPDQGYAWVYLTAAFFIELLAFGYTYSVGIIYEYWSSHLFPSAEDRFNLTLSSTLQSGFLYISAIVITPTLNRFPEYRAIMQYCGLTASVAGIIGSAFVTRSWQLLVTIGFLYPAGASVLYIPAATMVFDWFAQKRGIANGVMYSGTGVGGAIIPIIMQTLLSKFGYKAAVLSLGIGYGLLGVVAVYFIRERVPVTKRGRMAGEPERRRVPYSTFLKRSSFWSYGATITITSLGGFLPTIYVPTYAADLGLSRNTGTLLLILMNVASVFGLLGQGWLSDRMPIKVVVFISCAGAALTSFLLFGFATNVAVLTLFSIFWGLTALGFSSLWTRIISTVAADDPILPPTLYGIYFSLRGIANLVSGPISNRLLGNSGLAHARFAYGVGNYGSLILFIGAVNLAGCMTGIAYRKPKAAN